MIPGLLLYGTTVALLVALGGLPLEAIAARHGWPRRGVWAATLLCSMAVPVGVALMPPAPAQLVPASTPSEPAPPFHEERAEPMAALVQPAALVRTSPGLLV